MRKHQRLASLEARLGQKRAARGCVIIVDPDEVPADEPARSEYLATLRPPGLAAGALVVVLPDNGRGPKPAKGHPGSSGRGMGRSGP